MHRHSSPADPQEVAPTPPDASFDRGDRVAAVRNMETTQGLYIPAGSEGTIAEDRGSTLVVFFHHQTPPTNLHERDLHHLARTRKPVATD